MRSRKSWSGRTGWAIAILVGLGLVGPGAGEARPLPALQGHVVRQQLQGVEVLGGGESRLTTEDGRIRWRQELRPRARPFDLAGLRWNLDAAAAVRLAVEAEHRFVPRAEPDPRLARSFILPVGEGVPIWRVHLPPVRGLAYNPVFYVDARTGRILHRENRIFTEGRVRVYPGNPLASPDPVEEQLVGLDSLAPGSFLAGDLVRAFNCPDRHELIDVTFMGMRAQVHLCSEVQLAAADAQGDFLFDPSTPNDVEDLFAESHMYFHVMRAYQRFQALGFDRLRQKPLRAVVNFRIPDLLGALSPDGELYPFDNAFFLPAGDLSQIISREEDSIVFGQGTEVDFAYDADVIYHEFTHAVVDTAAGLMMTTLDDWGVSVAGGSLHEGYADFFASTLTGDPRVGEYAGSGLTEDGSAIRDISVAARCPDDLIGEVHWDSAPWSYALWKLRGQLVGAGSSADAFDQAVLAGLQALPVDAGFGEAAAATLAALRVALGEPAAAAAEAIFREQGVDGCARVLTSPEKELMLLPGMAAWNLTNFAPGMFQFRIETVPEHGLAVIEFDLPEAGPVIPGFGGGSPIPVALVRAGAEPIVVEYVTRNNQLRCAPNAQRMADAVDLDAGQPRWPHRMRAAVPFTPGQTVVHLMLGNRAQGSGDTYLEKVRVFTEPDPENPYQGDADLGVPDGGGELVVDGGGELVVDGGGEKTAADGGGESTVDGGVIDTDPDVGQPVDGGTRSPDQGPGERQEPEESEEEGCGCRAAPTAAINSVLPLLLLLGSTWLLRRR